jgi:hypothetical protein
VVDKYLSFTADKRVSSEREKESAAPGLQHNQQRLCSYRVSLVLQTVLLLCTLRFDSSSQAHLDLAFCSCHVSSNATMLRSHMLALLRPHITYQSHFNSAAQLARRHAASAAPAEEEESGRGKVLVLLLLLPVVQLVWSFAVVHLAACMLFKAM